MRRSSVQSKFIASALWLAVGGSAWAQATGPNGTWTGTLTGGTTSLPLSLNISGTIDSPGQNIRQSPVAEIGFQQNTNRVNFAINNSALKGAFQGTLVDNCMFGTWSQGGSSGQPLILCRSGTAPPAIVNMTDLAGFTAEQPAIQRMLAQGIMTPTSAGHFTPTGTVTRAEFAEMLQHMFGLKAATNNAFSDVPASDQRIGAIAAAAPFMNRQIFCFGCQLTQKFLPDKVISRAEAAVYVVRVLGSEGKVQQVPAADLPTIAGRAADAVTWGPLLTPLLAVALQSHLLDVESDNTLQPAKPLQRVHAAVLFDTAQLLGDIPVRK